MRCCYHHILAKAQIVQSDWSDLSARSGLDDLAHSRAYFVLHEKTTPTDLQHIQNYICIPSNTIFRLLHIFFVPLQISIITITHVFLRDRTILDMPANQLTFGYFEMIIGTVQKQVSTGLIDVKVMCQFQNPLTAMSFNELSMFFPFSVKH